MVSSRQKSIFVYLFHLLGLQAYKQEDGTNRNFSYFLPYETGFVGIYGDPNNFQRERINEGSFEHADKELIYENLIPIQVCPGMVGPFSDGSYYCTAKEYGYCDRRSGTCFCNMGYQGIQCSECTPSYFLVGSLCYPKKLCPDDCSGAGTCNYFTGQCVCYPHRIGENCGTQLCQKFDALCEACSNSSCLRCTSGYYVTDESKCNSCFDYDPRCAGCTRDLGCTLCADPILTSVRRSGYRSSDPRVPIEEDNREFSITLPFATKSVESFADAEAFVIASSPDKPLKDNSKSCHQGYRNDESWECEPFPASHIVCGHKGVFSFTYPNYIIHETSRFFRVSVRRSGGGYENVKINYFIKHYTTNDADVTATAPYTTSQTLDFSEGVVERSFLVSILDDNIVEENEIFQIVLEPPEGGGSVGAQFRTNVTIVDDDFEKLSPVFTHTLKNSITSRANATFEFIVQSKAANGLVLTTGGAYFLAIIENDESKWSAVGGTGQRHSLRTKCIVTDNNNGTYTVGGSLSEQGSYQLRIWNAFPLGLKAFYYKDAFMENIALERIDRFVNFTWGTGRITPRGSDYISARWVGVLRPDSTDEYYLRIVADDYARLWIDGALLIDHWHRQEAYLEPFRKINLEEGVFYEVILEYCEIRGEAYASLQWTTSSEDNFEAIPPENMFSLHEIGSSPIEIVVTSGQTSALETECTGRGLFASTALHASTFQCCPRDKFRNFRNDDDKFYLSSERFNVSLFFVDDGGGHEGDGSEILWPVLTYDETTFCFNGQYTPDRAGRYVLKIQYMTMVGFEEYSEDVFGSPFTVEVAPDKMSGPHSIVRGLDFPQQATAGQCFTFIVTAKDASNNIILRGGENLQVYIFRTGFFSNANEENNSTEIFNDSINIVRYGTVVDLRNGKYLGEMCPLTTGWYEMHILLNAFGVSNLPKHVVEYSFRGQYVDRSPYRIYVGNGLADGITSSVEVEGNLLGCTVGITSSFMITLRDSWGNVVRDHGTDNIKAYFPLMPNVVFQISNLFNGSVYLEFIPDLIGDNTLEVLVNGNTPIQGSPFVVTVRDGIAESNYSYALGSGLSIGTAGELSSFVVLSYDLSNNRKKDKSDIFRYKTSGSEFLEGSLKYCDGSDESIKYCDTKYGPGGIYYATFVPTKIGVLNISVSLVHYDDDLHFTEAEISNSPFFAHIHPGSASAENSDISGTIYNATVGIEYFVSVQLRDEFHNPLESGGADLELHLDGVAGDWGTALPFESSIGDMNEYHYAGHFGPYPDVYGIWNDNRDGSYIAMFKLVSTGVYVMRLSVAEIGLNTTYFNDTSFGYLVDMNDNPSTYSSTQDVNLGSTISWTGDIGRRYGSKGTLGESSYFHRFKSIVSDRIGFDLHSDRLIDYDGNYTLPVNVLPFNEKFREDFWSVRYIGLLTPQFAETYTFTMEIDLQSRASLVIGGLGYATNNSLYGTNVISIGNQSSVGKGVFVFKDKKMQELVLEYVHTSNSIAECRLFWQSPSTPYAEVPPSAFRHWRNISHFNLTANPNTLCSRCSSAFGRDLRAAVVGKLHSFTVYARDSYSNLMQVGGDMPSMVAVGPNGVAFRGVVTDYRNSTYLIEYYPTQVGIYRMYVSIGCCPAHPNVGVARELDMMREILIKDAPFLLNVSASKFASERCVATGRSLVSGEAGLVHSFDVLFRDIHNNPTIIKNEEKNAVSFHLQFTDISTGNTVINNAEVLYEMHEKFARAYFNLTKAGNYSLHIYLSEENIAGSPFTLTVRPSQASPSSLVVRGVGKRFAHMSRQNTFEIIVRDQFENIFLHGGSIFHIRFAGVSAIPGVVVVPQCNDLSNGHYNCSYLPFRTGRYELRISLLTSHESSPGGNGLLGTYYSNKNGQLPDARGNLIEYPFVKRVDSSINFRWSRGLEILKSDFGNFYENYTLDNSNLLSGFRMQWEGYLVAPITDQYIVYAVTKNINVTIFIDGHLVFDSFVRDIEKIPLNFFALSSYKIRLEATLRENMVDPQDIILKLMWSTPAMHQSLIPTFFLYTDATAAAFSPFQVEVT